MPRDDHSRERQQELATGRQGRRFRGERVDLGPSAVHQAWVQTYTPSAVDATVEMSSAVCPGVRSSRTEGLSSAPCASLSSHRSPS